MNSSKTSECKDGVNENTKPVRANEDGREMQHTKPVPVMRNATRKTKMTPQT